MFLNYDIIKFDTGYWSSNKGDAKSIWYKTFIANNMNVNALEP